jgi:acetyl-CoA acetyltransferase
LRKVAIAGAAMCRFGKFPELSVQDLGWPVVKAAVRDAGIAGFGHGACSINI